MIISTVNIPVPPLYLMFKQGHRIIQACKYIYDLEGTPPREICATNLKSVFLRILFAIMNSL